MLECPETSTKIRTNLPWAGSLSRKSLALCALAAKAVASPAPQGSDGHDRAAIPPGPPGSGPVVLFETLQPSRCSRTTTGLALPQTGQSRLGVGVEGPFPIEVRAPAAVPEGGCGAVLTILVDPVEVDLAAHHGFDVGLRRFRDDAVRGIPRSVAGAQNRAPSPGGRQRPARRERGTPPAVDDVLSTTVEKCAYSLKSDVVLDNGKSFDLASPATMAGSPLLAMESPLHLGLRRVTRRAEA